jgi:hypothetical protein
VTVLVVVAGDERRVRCENQEREQEQAQTQRTCLCW